MRRRGKIAEHFGESEQRQSRCHNIQAVSGFQRRTYQIDNAVGPGIADESHLALVIIFIRNGISALSLR